jgi:sugar lactone lactonase YvrE
MEVRFGLAVMRLSNDGDRRQEISVPCNVRDMSFRACLIIRPDHGRLYIAATSQKVTKENRTTEAAIHFIRSIWRHRIFILSVT